jgi:antitoxin component HigA of HigAB toxin-antitoxin module
MPNIEPKKYRTLALPLPAVIETEEQNERMLAEVDKLMMKEKTPEEGELFQIMVALIQDFEDKHYQFNASGPCGGPHEMKD